MIKSSALTLICILFGSILGIYSAYFTLKSFHNFKNYKLSRWYSNSPPLSEDANPYRLAKYSLNQQIDLQTNDDIILRTNTDQNGDKLLANCIYKLTNINLPCSFFTLYSEDDKGTNYAQLAKNAHPSFANLPYELNSQNLLKYYNKDLNNIMLAPATNPQGNNWLTTPTHGNYNLVLTLHNLTLLRTQAAKFSLPNIQKISCPVFQ